jgi:hypothetical protein
MTNGYNVAKARTPATASIQQEQGRNISSVEGLKDYIL